MTPSLFSLLPFGTLFPDRILLVLISISQAGTEPSYDLGDYANVVFSSWGFLLITPP